MMYSVTKILVSAALIGIVTEIARRFPLYGGVLAALPLVSLLSLFWLNIQGETSASLSKFALGVLWGLPATTVFLIIVYVSLRTSFHLYLSILIGVAGWLMCLFLQERFVSFMKAHMLN